LVPIALATGSVLNSFWSDRGSGDRALGPEERRHREPLGLDVAGLGTLVAARRAIPDAVRGTPAQTRLFTDVLRTLASEAVSIRAHERVGEGMSEVLVAREPVSAGLAPPLIELAGVEKVYRTGKVEYRALRGVNLAIESGDMVAIVGPSGSGKSTIMNMITGIDRPSAGTVTVDGRRIDEMSEEELAIWRGRRVGVIFQFFQLLPTLTALENAMLPLDFSRRVPKRERAPLAMRNLELVGLADKAGNLPSEMSGGQQQRVAIARALAADPPLLIGDEPTGNLDTRTASEMFDLLQRLNASGSTILYVTHDRDLAAQAHRTITIRDGVVAA
jgi:putative ABC transport system ATP-binding protein